MKKNYGVSIIIVNWNGAIWLDRLLNSIRGQTYPNIEVVLVDNGSTDQSISIVKNYNEVVLIESKQNLGFAGGNNLGIKNASKDLILLLNTDTWLPKNTIQLLVDGLIDNELDVVAPYETTYDGVTKSMWQKITIDPLGHPAFLKRGGNQDSFYLPGICLLFSKDLYKQTLGLDNGFFMYCEELDWFWRLNLLGKKIGFINNAEVCHKGAGSTGEGLQYNLFLWRNQNTLQMLLKNYSLPTLLVLLPLYFLQNVAELLIFFLLFKPKLSKSYILGWQFCFSNRKKILNERAKVQNMRLVPDRVIFKKMYLGSAKMLHVQLRLKAIIAGKKH